MKIIILFVLGLFFTQITLAQNIIESSSWKKPEWISKPPIGNSYFYYTGMGSDNHSINAAKDAALADILNQLSFLTNSTIQVNSTFERSEKTNVQISGNENIKYSDNFVQIIKVNGEEITITGLKKEEEYWQKINTNEKISYQYWLLMKIPKPNIIVTDIKQGYGLEGVWRSAIIPGWGQLYKKEIKKGVGIMGGTGVLAISIVITYSQYKSNLRLAKQNSNISIKTQYIDRADNWRNSSYVCIAGLATLYIYNIIDAATSKGAKKYASKSNKIINFYAFYDNQSTLSTGISFNF